MQRVVGVGLFLIAIGVAIALGIQGMSWLGVPVVLGGSVIFWGLRLCRHPGPLALLPPTTDFTGVRQPARWYCDKCGRTWEANFERVQRPVQKFVGYDETKAMGSAKRAAELADKRRALALDRAGFKPARRSKPAPAAVVAVESADVVQIAPRRRLVS